ncbi:MAG TPA: ATP-binding protein [Pyrinomonadaceae bacterium]|jgi:serine/threonine-protein kinase RsbW
MHRRILIIDDHNDLAEALEEVFTRQGHEVRLVEDRAAALAIEDIYDYDFVITDLDFDTVAPVSGPNGNSNVCLPKSVESHIGEHIKAFKICASNFRRQDFDEQQLAELVATTLDYKNRFVDSEDYVRGLHESIEFELPGVLSVMHVVLEYLMNRVDKLGVVEAQQSNLFVALDEAFVNAVKHGNKFDATKNVRVAADVSKTEARFTIEDEGEGFDVDNIPDPLDPLNLFKPSGRGVLFIYNIMDEVKYNERGNRLTMIKRSQPEAVKS